MRTLLIALVRPRKLAAAVSEGPAWVMPLVWLSLLEMAFAVLLYDQTVHAVLARLPEGATLADKMAVENGFADSRTLEVLFRPFRLAAGCACSALVLYGLLQLFFLPSRPKFHQVFSLVVHAELILVLGRGAKWVNGLLAGPLRDAGVPFSLTELFPRTSFLQAHVLGSLNLFSLWSTVILAVGIVQMTGLKWWKAALTVAVAWALAVGSNAFGLSLLVSFFHYGL